MVQADFLIDNADLVARAPARAAARQRAARDRRHLVNARVAGFEGRIVFVGPRPMPPRRSR